MSLRIRIFAHSWFSDWNHGNAHFLRGLARELIASGHELRCYEESEGWSMRNLRQEGPIARESIAQFRSAFPSLDVRTYRLDDSLAAFLDRELDEADLVLVHEWSDPHLVAQLLDRKQRLGFRALFHDTHHRAYTNPSEILRLPLDRFDGVLAFGEAIRRIYAEAFAVPRVWTFHEAADIRHFYPIKHPHEAPTRNDLVWIGNWGDEERTRELMDFLVEPGSALAAEGHRLRVYGVRYPPEAIHALSRAGIDYAGYLPNLAAPQVYAESLLALHVPRRQYANGLSGVPTIRVFEALASGIPLLCSPWSDAEHLFRPGRDYLVAQSGPEMLSLARELLRDESARRQLAASGLETIRRHHTCAHRAAQLTQIYEEIAR
jgi:spore maturation protein CgeB